MSKVDVFRIFGSTFPAMVGWITLFLACSGITLVFEPEKYNKYFPLIWPAAAVGWAYFVEGAHITHFMDFKYSVLDQANSFEAWFILPPLIAFTGYLMVKKINLNYIIIESILVFFILNIAYLVGVFSVVVALAMVGL